MRWTGRGGLISAACCLVLGCGGRVSPEDDELGTRQVADDGVSRAGNGQSSGQGGGGRGGGSASTVGGAFSMGAAASGGDFDDLPECSPSSSRRPTPREAAACREAAGDSDVLDGDAPDIRLEDLPEGPWEPLSTTALLAACAGGVPPLDALFSGLRSALERAPAADRPFLRFVSITPDLEMGCRAFQTEPRDVRRHWAAVSKLLNSLSLRTTSVLPVSLPELPSVLQLDLRDYGWQEPLTDEAGTTHATHWEAVVQGAGQRLPLIGNAAQRVSELTSTQVPLLLSGDFMASASQAPLYYDLLHLPRTLGGLRAELGLSAEELEEPSLWARAGFNTSGVAKQHASLAMFLGELESTWLYWERYDFHENSTLPGPYLAPLARDADQYSVIFGLPNGLFGYFVADGEGRRLARGLTGIDIDPAQNQGELNAAASCTSCHNSGLIPFTDTVGETVAESGADYPEQVRRDVALSYPAVEALNDLVERDSGRFVAALERAGQERGSPDPSARVFLSYDLGLQFPQMAGELFVTEAELRRALPRLPPEFAVAEFSGGLERAAFNRIYTQSACVLHGGNESSPECAP